MVESEKLDRSLSTLDLNWEDFELGFWNSVRLPAEPSGRDGDIKAICYECGYDEEWGRLPPFCAAREVISCQAGGVRP